MSVTVARAVELAAGGYLVVSRVDGSYAGMETGLPLCRMVVTGVDGRTTYVYLSPDDVRDVAHALQVVG